MKAKIEQIRRDLRKIRDPERARVMQGFFKTGPGEYGEGDVFLGVSVPDLRKIAKAHQVDLDVIRELLRSKIHEERLLAVLMLVRKYKSDPQGVAAFYLDNLDHVNNWDMVDVSAPSILGAHLVDGDRSVLFKLARSDDVWKRRVAIVATQHFIRQSDFDDTIKIAEILINDRHDLIHKAAGWMLREVGKKDTVVLEKFLARNCASMPRTMLRYAIESLPEKKRKFYMAR